MVVPAAELEAHWAVLDVKAKQILSPLTTDQEAEPMSLDRAFTGIQKLNCGAVYADHANLKLLIEGLQRAAIEFDVVPLWVESAEIDVELQRLADRQSQNQKAIASRQQEIAAQAALDAERASASEVVRAKAETQLRQRFAQEANAAFGELSKTGEAFFRHSDSAPYSFTALFPQIAQRQAQLDEEGWELDQFNSAMIDYGTAEWKGRRAEVVFAEMRVRSKNRMRGEYAEDCFAVGYLIDAEFNLIRDPVESECGKFTGAISSWKTGRSFESRWIVN